MNLLVTNNTLGNIPGGSEWHAHELALALHRKGHNVTAYTPVSGWFGNSLIDKGVKVCAKPPRGDFDLILASHLSTIRRIDRDQTRGKMIQICHGVTPPLEQPSDKVDAHVAISEEVQDHLSSKGVSSKVIYNGVDHNKFLDHNGGEGVLSLCQGPEANRLIESACKKIGCRFAFMNKTTNPSFELEFVIPKYNTVVAIGRGAYEAMACNRNLIVADSRGYVEGGTITDGIATTDNLPDIMKNNCSGRRTKKNLGMDRLIPMLERCLSKEKSNLRSFSEKELNIDIQADKYLSMV
tara:strand:- start:626 stop:1510 length:885 start_codon:yes stop_codon:yes gene_type:complete